LPAFGMTLGVAICLLVAGIATAWLLPARDPQKAGEPEDPAALAMAIQPLRVDQIVPDGGAPPNPPRPPDVDGPRRPEPMSVGDVRELDRQRVSGRDTLPESSVIETPMSESLPIESLSPGTPAVELSADGVSAEETAAADTSAVEADSPAPVAAVADAGVPAPVPAPPTPERGGWKPNDGGQHVAVSAYGSLLVPKGEACGTDVCAVGQSCCNASCGTCVSPGGTCSQLSCSMPRYPVSMPCGRNTCSVGQVCCNFSCGICAAPGASCSDQLCD